MYVFAFVFCFFFTASRMSRLWRLHVLFGSLVAVASASAACCAPWTGWAEINESRHEKPLALLDKYQRAMDKESYISRSQDPRKVDEEDEQVRAAKQTILIEAPSSSGTSTFVKHCVN